jgi:hypothetical protein
LFPLFFACFLMIVVTKSDFRLLKQYLTLG